MEKRCYDEYSDDAVPAYEACPVACELCGSDDAGADDAGDDANMGSYMYDDDCVDNANWTVAGDPDRGRIRARAMLSEESRDGCMYLYMHMYMLCMYMYMYMYHVHVVCGDKQLG